ncbi:PQQ-binding-like beta-propeller repeat protein [Nannocystis pusilla]|uniref:outer membrane protein assembly factor BamB family protein n=1 Tax=Nannocystis pusilla TaxID=889268 RepID=UPI003DA4C0F2
MLAVAPTARARWTELGDGTFIPFAPEDPTAFGLPRALDPSPLPTELRGCQPFRGLRTTIMFFCDGGGLSARLVAARRDNWAIEWRLPHPGPDPEERVYFGRNTFIVAGVDDIAYSLATGKPVWRRDTFQRNRVEFRDPAVYLVGEPQGPAGLVAFDFDTGAELWRMDRYCHVLAGADGLVVDHPGGIYRVDPQTGSIVDTLGSPRERCRRGEDAHDTAWMADGRIFAATHEPASGYAIEASYLSSGKLLWRRPVVWPHFVVAHDAVYVWNAGTLLALDPATGDSLAEHTIPFGTRRMYAAGGAFGPLLVQQSHTWVTTLGRVAAPAASETYSVRGRIVQREADALWLGPHELLPQVGGRFTVQGRRSVGTRFELVRSDGDPVKPLLTLDGRREYDVRRDRGATGSSLGLEGCSEALGAWRLISTASSSILPFIRMSPELDMAANCSGSAASTLSRPRSPASISRPHGCRGSPSATNDALTAT